MSSRDSLNRKIVSSGRFNPSANDPSVNPETSAPANLSQRPTSLSSLKDIAFVQAAGSQIADDTIAKAFEKYTDSQKSLTDWGGIRSLSDLGAILNRRVEAPTSNKIATSNGGADLSKSILSGFSAFPVDQMLKDPDRSSSTQAAEQEMSSPQFKFADKPTDFQGADSNYKAPLLLNIDDNHSELSKYSNSASPIGLESSPVSLNSSSVGSEPSTPIDVKGNGGSPGVWQHIFGIQNSPAFPQDFGRNQGRPSNLDFLSRPDESNLDGLTPSASGNFENLADNSLTGMGSSLNSMFATQLYPNAMSADDRGPDQESSQGPSFGDSLGGNGSAYSNASWPSANVASQGQGGGVDLSKTNELLQQLIEEVRKGRQGFLPIADRNESY